MTAGGCLGSLVGGCIGRIAFVIFALVVLMLYIQYNGPVI